MSKILVPRTSSSGLRNELNNFSDSVFDSNYHQAINHLNEMERIIDSYYTSRGIERRELNRTIKKIRACLRRGWGQRAVRNMKELVNSLKSDEYNDPREKLSNLRMELEQAVTDLMEGEISREECLYICRNALSDMGKLKGEFRSLDDNGWEGIYSLYADAMESVGEVRSGIFDLVKLNKRSGPEMDSLEEMERKIEKVVSYDPEKVSIDRGEEGEEVNPEELIGAGVKMLVEQGKSDQLSQIKEMVDEMVEERVEEENLGGIAYTEGGPKKIEAGESPEELFDRLEEEEENG